MVSLQVKEALLLAVPRALVTASISPAPTKGTYWRFYVGHERAWVVMLGRFPIADSVDGGID
jgi:hypothetical protein